MKYKKIVLAGGSGYLGQVLAEYYKPLVDQVIILSRKPAGSNDHVQTVLWDGKTAENWIEALDGADLLVNLCGKNVNCRYTKKNRKEIFASRNVPTRLLNQVLSKLERPPKVWINVTSATIYRHAEDHAQDEDTGEIGYGFSIDVCKQWEAAFFETEIPKTRKIALRMGIVLGRHDSAFPRLLNLVKCGLGGRQGDGEQYISWVHEHDVARSTEWILDQNKLDGVINCVAPDAIKNATFMQLLRKAYGIPFGLSSPQWLLEIGMLVIGSETELILKSRWVAPVRLLDSGFKFHFAEAKHAIHDILSLRI